MTKIDKGYSGSKLKGYIIGIVLTILSGVVLGLSVPLLEFAGTTGIFLLDKFGYELPLTAVLTNPLFYIAILCQIFGGLINYFALTYIRAAIATPIYGSVQIFQAVIIAQILLPATNPWSDLYLVSMILIVIAITLISYSVSKKPEQEVEDLLPPAPRVETPDELINKGFSAVFEMLDLNLIAPYGRIRHRWAMAGKKYSHPMFLESCFISLVWKTWMPEIAQEILEPFFDAQGEDGLFPSELKLFGKKYMPQPPIMAHVIRELDLPVEFLKKAYPKLKKFREWYFKNRRNADGFYYWKHPEESGMPESPRFAGKRDISKIVPVDLNVYIVLQNVALAEMAALLEFSEDGEGFEVEAINLMDKIRKELWNSSLNSYCDKNLENNGFIEVLSLTNLTPLLAKIPSEEQLDSILKLMTDPSAFYTPMPLPLLAISEPKFRPDKTGAVSIKLAYLILQGLKMYEKDELISELASRLINMVFINWKDSTTFIEYYSPDSTKHQLIEKPCGDYVGSTGLINTMLIEEIIGLHVKSRDVMIHPRLPNSWLNKTITYASPTKDLNLTMIYKDSGEIEVTLMNSQRKDSFSIQNHSSDVIQGFW